MKNDLFIKDMKTGNF